MPRSTRKTDDAWAAGVIDGDGCVTIKRRRKSRAEGFAPSSAYFALWVIVGQSGATMPDMLKRLRWLYGGQIDPLKQVPGRQKKWHWYVASARAEVFLRHVAPYVVQKRDQVRIALEYRRRALGRGKFELALAYYKRLRATKHYVKTSAHWTRRAV